MALKVKNNAEFGITDVDVEQVMLDQAYGS